MLRIFLILLILPFAAAAAPAPRQGYIETPDGVHLFYKMVGSGREKLVVVHGGPGNSLRSLEPDFVPLEKVFTIVYYDQRGNGRSDLIDDPHKLSLDRHIADLEAVRAHFGLVKMKLLGNSWGGLLVAAYAAAHPDRIERMVMHDPAPPLRAQMAGLGAELDRRARSRLAPDQRRRLAMLFDAEYRANVGDPRGACREWAVLLLPLMTAQGNAPGIKGDLCDGSDEAMRVQQRVNNQIWATMGDFDLRPGMGRVEAPVLIVYGTSDYVPLDGAREWARSMPNARLLPIANAGHTPQGEQPGIFFPAVIEFLKGQWPAGAVAAGPAS